MLGMLYCKRAGSPHASFNFNTHFNRTFAAIAAGKGGLSTLDAAVHQLVSHFGDTHAVMEPFAIANSSPAQRHAPGKPAMFPSCYFPASTSENVLLMCYTLQVGTTSASCTPQPLYSIQYMMQIFHHMFSRQGILCHCMRSAAYGPQPLAEEPTKLKVYPDHTTV